MNQARVAIVIPARYGSSRLPGKPLVEIAGKPMIQHVYERACEVPGVDAVLVATDDVRVQDAVEAFDGRCLMTDPNHPTGTDRLVEVMQQVEADIYINLQGDEPLMRAEDVARLVEGMRADPAVDVGTLCHVIDSEEAESPNAVKVVRANNGDALYFSRARIPYPRDAHHTPRYLKHIGIYAYRRATLEQFSGLPRPELEQIEQLEQLRLLAAGVRIRVYELASAPGPGVDTPQCLERVRQHFGDE